MKHKYEKSNFKYINSLILMFICLILPYTYICDLPVHCLVNEVEGVWLLHMSNNNNENSVKCGHEHPDKNLDHIKAIPEINDFNTKAEIIVKVERPNNIYSVKRNEQNKKIGSWTMIYDEGFEMSFGNYVFFAFLRYEQANNFVATNTDTEDTPGYKSVCGKTFVGWFRNTQNANWGCYWAEKLDKPDIYNTQVVSYDDIFATKRLEKNKRHHLKDSDWGFESMITGSDNNNTDKIVANKDKNKLKKNKQNNDSISHNSKKIVDSDNTLNDTPSSSENKSEGKLKYVDFLRSLILSSENDERNQQNTIPHLDIYFLNSNERTDYNFLEHSVSVSAKSKLFIPDEEYVKKINNPKNGYLWQATVYDQFVGKSYKSMRSLLGNSNFLNKMVNFSKDPLDDVSKIESQTFIELSVDIQNSSSSSAKSGHSQKSKVPPSFTWTNVDGVNYDSVTKRQGECGSCYALAMLSVFESRLRIKTNNRDKTILSSSSVIGCSRMNQGCSGGYPYLVGKHGFEFGFVEETCQPYSEDDKTCKSMCFEDKTYFAKSYGYVGGYYGACTESLMMDEIYSNGPIVVAINATPELYYYKSGIFHSDANKKEGRLEKGVKPWEYTNHAVVAVGWGEEYINDKLEKFWILKNSWGEDWGEKGYFRISKGVNMASVEAQGVYINPKV